MAYTTKKINGTLANSNGTLLTVPAVLGITIVSMWLINKTATEAVATISFDGTIMVPAHIIPPNDTLPIEFKNMPTLLEAADLLEGFSDTAAAIDFYITYVEETA